MRNILFTLKRPGRYTGGLLKYRDYFDHCLSHPALEPYICYWESDIDAIALHQEDSIWGDIPLDRVTAKLDLTPYDAVVLGSAGWKRLSKDERRKAKRISIFQTLWAWDEVRHLTRSVHRICVSQELYDCYAPLMARGTTTVIPNGIPLDIFRPAEQRRDGSVVIWGKKNPELAARLERALRDRGVDAVLLRSYAPRERFARALSTCDIFVPLPFRDEAFYLPALEGMACCAAVVCSDAVGNRSFCVHDETCLMPRYDDFDGHLAAIDQLLDDPEGRQRVRKAGLKMAQEYSLDRERERFYQFLEEMVFEAPLR